jgi:hypothetical protein
VETAAEKPSIFISYARSDSSALAEELVGGLETRGLQAVFGSSRHRRR